MRLPGSQNPKNCQNLHRVAKVGLATTLISQGKLARLLGRDHTDNLVINLRRNARGARGAGRSLEQEHPQTLRAMNNLAEALKELRGLTGARKLLEQVVEADVRLLGPEHPDSLRAKNNLAQVLYEQGSLPAFGSYRNTSWKFGFAGSDRSIPKPWHRCLIWLER